MRKPPEPPASPPRLRPGRRAVEALSYSDAPMDWRTRLVGLGGTTAIGTLLMLGLFVTWRLVSPLVAPPAPLVVNLMAFEAPPEPVQEVPEGPPQVEQKQQKREEKEEAPEPPEALPPVPSSFVVAPEPPAEAAVATDPVPATTAPKSLPAPPAPRASSASEVTWEALLLAHLEKYRRYPPAARARREQGVVHVLFRMNRQGQLLAASIARSSGSQALDRAALDALRRAQPLPAIPDDRPDTIELSLPVEFFTR